MDPDAQLLYMGIVSVIGLFIVFIFGTAIGAGVFIAGYIIGFFTAVSAAVYMMSKGNVIYGGKVK